MSDEADKAGRTRFREPVRTRTKAAPRSADRTRFAEPAAVEPAAAEPAAVEPAAAEPAAAEPVVSTTKSMPPPAPEQQPARRGNVLALVATITAVVLLAGTIVFAVLYVRQRSDADALADSRTTVLRTAQKTAIDFSSYDYRQLDQDFAGVASQLTPTFRKSYQKTAGSLKATLSQYQAVGTAKVLDAGVASLSGRKATVVVFLDQTVTSKTSPTPTVDRNRIRVSLERSGDRWLVSKLDVR